MPGVEAALVLGVWRCIDRVKNRGEGGGGIYSCWWVFKTASKTALGKMLCHLNGY